jgi:hypothetical protein
MALPSVLQDYPGFGEQLGTGLGQGLGSTLQSLANMKLNQLVQKQQMQQASQTFQKLPGVTSEVADFLSALSPEERKYPLQNLGSLMQLGQALGPQAAQHIQPQQTNQPGIQNLSQLLSNPGQQGLNQVSPLIAQALGKTPIQQQTAQPVQTGLPKGAPASNQADLVSDIFTSPEEKRKRRKEEREERKLAQEEKAQRFKVTAAERKEISDKAKSARQQLHDLDRMEELEKTGKLDTPGYVEFLKRSGLDIPALMNPESEEFQKLAAGFLRDAKSVFGARVSNFEIEQFLKTIPSLSQSADGRRRVIANLKYLQRGNLAYAEALREITRENEGIPPYDLADQIDDRIDAKLDKVSEKFKADLEKPVPRSSPKLATALGSFLGSVVGAPGTLLKGLAGALGHGAA